MAEKVTIASVTFGKGGHPIVLLSDGKVLSDLTDVRVDGFLDLSGSSFSGSIDFIGNRRRKPIKSDKK